MAEHVCPFWIGYLLASPVRKLFQDPAKILGPHVAKGMKVLDFGCAMGFFSLPLARLVGPDGKVFCVDVQEKMIRSLEKRARRAGLLDRMETRLCSGDGLGMDGLEGGIDFAVLFYVVHEIPDPLKALSEIRRALKPNARLLITEPKGHVSAEEFEKTIARVEGLGFKVEHGPGILRSRCALFSKS